MTSARVRRLATGVAGALALVACAETTVDPVETTVPATSLPGIGFWA